MTKYRGKQASSHAPVTFQGTAPATPRKPLTLQPSSLFPDFSADCGFDSRMDKLFGHTKTSRSDETAEEEFQKYISGRASPRETDILHFWMVSSFILSGMNVANSDYTDQSV